jgi:hypothetical protein
MFNLPLYRHLYRHREKIAAWYLTFLPSLLIFTKLGERTYQDVVFAALIIFFLRNRRYTNAKAVWVIWSAWLFYAVWSLITDFIGSGAYHGGWFIRVELMLLFPVFVAYASQTDFAAWLLRGFKIALVSGTVVSFCQVVIFGNERAHGAENELVFAACISIYGLFVIHETLRRENEYAGIWVALTLSTIVLSGSRGVLISILGALLLLACCITRKQFLRSIVSPVLLLALIALPFAGRIPSRADFFLAHGCRQDDARRDFLRDFINKDFSTVRSPPPAAASARQNGLPARTLREEYKTSCGYRLVLLRGGWEVFLQHPFLGVGSAHDTLRAGQALGIGSDLTLYSHVHNAFLQDMVAGGIIKLGALLAVLFLPLFCLYKEQKKKEFTLLLITTVNYIIFGFTNMLFQLTTINIINTLILVYIFTVKDPPLTMTSLNNDNGIVQ